MRIDVSAAAIIELDGKYLQPNVRNRLGGLGREEIRRQMSVNEGSSENGSLLNADQVAEILGVPKTWVYEQSRAGRIPTVTLGRYRRYRREAIADWVQELERAGRRPRAAGPIIRH